MSVNKMDWNLNGFKPYVCIIIHYHYLLFNNVIGVITIHYYPNN